MTVKCTYCGWEGEITDLEEDFNRLEKWSVCPECGSASKDDYLEIDGRVP